MTTYDPNCPTSIRESMQWKTVFRECGYTSQGPWLTLSLADMALTIEWNRDDPASVEMKLSALERGLTGISQAFAELTPEDVQAAVATVAKGNRRKLPIGGGLTISATSKLITIQLTTSAHRAVTDARHAAELAYDKAITRTNVLRLLDIIEDGTSTTIAGKIVTRDASDAIDILVQNVGSLQTLPPHLAEPDEQDED